MITRDDSVCVMLIARNRRQHDRFGNGLTYKNLLAHGHRSRRGLLLNIGYHFLWWRIDCSSDNGASYAADGCTNGTTNNGACHGSASGTFIRTILRKCTSAASD